MRFFFILFFGNRHILCISSKDLLEIRILGETQTHYTRSKVYLWHSTTLILCCKKLKVHTQDDMSHRCSLNWRRYQFLNSSLKFKVARLIGVELLLPKVNGRTHGQYESKEMYNIFIGIFLGHFLYSGSNSHLIGTYFKQIFTLKYTFRLLA